MKIVSKKVTIEWKLNPSLFRFANKDHVDEPSRRIGSSRKAVNAMVSNGELLKDLMPEILGLDPTSTSSNWHKSVKTYWDSLSMPIPERGTTIEIGLSYDVYADKPYLKELLKKYDSIKTDEDLYDWVEGTTRKEPNVRPEYKFRYATPIVASEYLLYLYLGHYRDVANSMDDADKSKSIRFYLVHQGEVEARKRIEFAKTEEANEKYVLVCKDEVKMDNMIYLHDADPNIINNILDKKMYLKAQSANDPEKFVRLFKDKNLSIKADIERMVIKGVLNRLPNTQIIVDASDPDSSLGSTMHETIAYFQSESKPKATKVKELYTKLNDLNN